MNLILRVIVGAALAVIFILLLWIGGEAFSLAIILFILGALWEFYGLGQAGHARPYRFTGMAAGVILMAYAHYQGMDAGALLIIAASAFILLGIHPFLAGAEARDWKDASFSITGYLYTALPGAIAISLRRSEALAVAAFPFLVICVFDIFAYFAGKAVGERRHRIFPRISPEKSWEGFAGGLVFACAAGALVNLLIGWPWHKAIAIAGTIASVGHIGDFFESSVKRDVGVKDSSRLLPGHGGILDRIDALLFAIPAYYLVINLWK
ncbi:MAG: phosphatidate cytidylyltransferase [candidate division WOR-3 bacterium]